MNTGAYSCFPSPPGAGLPVACGCKARAQAIYCPFSCSGRGKTKAAGSKLSFFKFVTSRKFFQKPIIKIYKKAVFATSSGKEQAKRLFIFAGSIMAYPAGIINIYKKGGTNFE
ncbi:HR_lesion [Pelotomaculum thermopropionicum SI]|uniref:HR_lesion n=1 Tax=Pelotomaculum thermopropionicum (strain DSM 13744 / JCM 10971 / SI) TaxID=370438 RepID=A5D342_PELTS|nr:HR_lesion [Pelotomaculum thermopropionicum SI]